MRNCEECFVIPKPLRHALTVRLVELGAETDEDAEEQLKTYLQGRRTTQTNMVLVRSI